MPSFELMSGTRNANRLSGAQRAADPSKPTILLKNRFEKRRWESNPLRAALQAAASPLGFSVVCVGRSWKQPTRNLSFVSKSSRRDWRHQKRPNRKQHARNSLRLPQGHRSRRPSFSSSCLSPCTIRTPRFTCVSEGNPLRRLLIGSKKLFVIILAAHSTPPFAVEPVDAKIMPSPGIEPGLRPSRGRVQSPAHSKDQQHPVEESNPVYDVRSVACSPTHSPGVLNIPTWIRTRIKTLGPSRAVLYTIGTQGPAAGFEPAWGCLQNSCIAVLPRWHQLPTSRTARIRTRCVSFGG